MLGTEEINNLAWNRAGTADQLSLRFEKKSSNDTRETGHIDMREYEVVVYQYETLLKSVFFNWIAL